MERVSSRLSHCLNIIGYRTELIEYRRNCFFEVNRYLNIIWPEYIQLTTGSKAEGIAKYYESDVDRLFNPKDVKCMNEGTTHSNVVNFHMDKTYSSPGYTRLVLGNLNKLNVSQEVSNSLIEENGRTCISNNFREIFGEFSEYSRNALRVDVTGSSVKRAKSRGPCISYRSELLSLDFVSGFECFDQDLLGKWKQRKRTCNWPSSQMIEQISNIGGHVVPVANVQSKFPNSEWRICFSIAELLLVNALDENHLKVYMLLKRLAKTFLQPICPAISSYIVKNVILWQAENTPNEHFAPNLLVCRLRDALKFLQECVKSEVLRSYMIEERNLFFGRISEIERKTIIDKMDHLLDKDEHIIALSKKLLEEFDYFDTPAFIRNVEQKTHIEKLLIQQSIAYLKVYDRSYTCQQFLDCLESDREYVDLKKELYKLVLPDKSHEPLKSDSGLFRRRLVQIVK